MSEKYILAQILRVQTEKRMQVDTIWNPDQAKVGDEIHLKAWMGQLQVKFTSQWNEQYIWYHASDMTDVSYSRDGSNKEYNCE